jgi:hypothetical protein
VVGLALAVTVGLADWLPCPGATAGGPPVITLAVGVGLGDWLGDAAVAGAAAVVAGGATGAAVVGAGAGTDEM